MVNIYIPSVSIRSIEEDHCNQSVFPEEFYIHLRDDVQDIYYNQKIETSSGLKSLFEYMIQRHIKTPYAQCSCESLAIRLRTLMKVMVGDLDFIEKEKERNRKNAERKDEMMKKNSLRARMRKQQLRKEKENATISN